MATELKNTEVNRAPNVQRGVCLQLPEGYGGPSVHWTGRASQLSSETCYVKLPKGFRPVEAVARLLPLLDAAAPQRTVADGSYSRRVADGTLAIPAGTYAFTGTSATRNASTGAFTPGTALFETEFTAPGALVGRVAIASGAVVTDDLTYVQVALDPAATLDPATADCRVEVLVRLEQVDPHPEKMF